MSPRRLSRRSLVSLGFAGPLALAGAIGCSDEHPEGGPVRLPTAAEGQGPNAEYDFEALRAALQGAIDAGQVEAAGLVIVKGGRRVFLEAFGRYTIESADLLWSATKLASATAVMSVIDDGLARLDDPISRYLPAFAGAKGAITIRQLLAQTHGLPADHPSIAAPLQDNGLTLAESVDQVARDLEPEYPAGSRHRYAPAASYAILGRIAEVVTAQSWVELFAERVGSPLAMKSFTYGETRNPRVGGGAACALVDYANLLQVHQEGGVFAGRRVLSEAAVMEMRRDQLHGLPFTSPAQKREHGYGLTWWFDEVDETGTAVQLSVPGGLGAIPWLNLQRRYAAFLLVRKTLAASVAVYESILPLINQSLDA